MKMAEKPSSSTWVFKKEGEVELLGTTVGGRYLLLNKIGSGSFGEVFLGISMFNQQEVAVKLERKSSKYFQLELESKIYKILKGGKGIPNIQWYGEEKEFNVLVMDFLGPSLEDLFNFCSRRFTIKTVLMLADQMVFRTEYLHTRNFIHRDIKPDNFLMGVGRHSNIVYIIDFGLATRYRNPLNRRHIKPREGNHLVGTARYASETAHVGEELSRKDDMMSLAYVLLYFIRGHLPWQGMKASTKQQKYEKIGNMKLSLDLDILCKNCPSEFKIFLEYCRHLRFEEIPDYLYIRTLFRNLFRTSGYEYDYMYDWVLLRKLETSTKTQQGENKSDPHFVIPSKPKQK